MHRTETLPPWITRLPEHPEHLALNDRVDYWLNIILKAYSCTDDELIVKIQERILIDRTSRGEDMNTSDYRIILRRIIHRMTIGEIVAVDGKLTLPSSDVRA